MAMKILRSPFPPVGIRLLHSFPLYHLTSVFASFPYWFWATEIIVLYVTSSGKERQFVHALCWISAHVGELIVRIQAKCRVERCCASVLVLSAISDPELSFSMGLLGYFMASYCELLPAMAQIVHVYPVFIPPAFTEMLSISLQKCWSRWFLAIFVYFPIFAAAGFLWHCFFSFYPLNWLA